METKNALIKSTQLGSHDSPGMMVWLDLDYGGTGQSFGGYLLDTPLKDKDGNFIRRQGTAFGLEYIMQLMEAIGVSSWEKIPGTFVRVVAEHNKVHKIGHILKDTWFDPEKLSEEFGFGMVKDRAKLNEVKP